MARFVTQETKFKYRIVTSLNRNLKGGVRGSLSAFIKPGLYTNPYDKQACFVTQYVCFYMMKSLNVFKVCKSVHYRTIQINHQTDATIFQCNILTFIYSSTCFGRFVFCCDVFVVGPNRPDHENSTTITTIRR
jgi:hypothetical protein